MCRSGFHFCTELQDIIKYYCNTEMRVFEVEATGLITDPEKDCSKHACSELKLVKELSLEEVKASINTSRQAYLWACYIGDREHMKQYITEPEYAYYWAKCIDSNDKTYFKNKGIL